MTGSAGTAMDVLVTCFNKKGGGSGRRGCQGGAGLGVRRIWPSSSENFLIFVSHFLQMSLKHSACHTFRASGHFRWGPFGDAFLSVFSMFFQVFGE